MLPSPPTLERLELYARAVAAAYAFTDREKSAQAVRMLAAAEMIREELIQQSGLPPDELRPWLEAVHAIAKGEAGQAPYPTP